jgi:hypothetical protein
MAESATRAVTKEGRDPELMNWVKNQKKVRILFRAQPFPAVYTSTMFFWGRVLFLRLFGIFSIIWSTFGCKYHRLKPNDYCFVVSEFFHFKHDQSFQGLLQSI